LVQAPPLLSHIFLLQMMTRKMTECGKSMIEGWENQIAQNKSKQIEMELNSQFLELTADIISHTAFGSSYIKGKEVFATQKELQNLAFATIFNVGIPGFQYAPFFLAKYEDFAPFNFLFFVF
jgi:cytochrome P450 family 709